jgi:hypothetical protein
MELVIKFCRFILGWVLYVIILFLSLFYSLIFWNWKETYTLDMEIVIKEIAGKTILDVMFLKKK